MSSTVDVHFTADKAFDYCVAKTTNSRKYELARTLGKPIVTATWLRDSAREGELLPLHPSGPSGDRERGYFLPAFAGLCVCVTGYTQDARAALEAQVVANGGIYTPDLVKGKCTHLVASNTNSSKYTHASKWDGVHIVSRAWVDECIAREVRADEALFPVSATFAADEGAAPTNTHTTAFTHGSLHPAADAATAWTSCCMLGTKVHLHGLGPPRSSAEAARARSIVRRLAAPLTPCPGKATHVVVSASVPPGSLRALRDHRDRVVRVTWLEACAAEEGVAAVEPHAPPPEAFSDRAPSGAGDRTGRAAAVRGAGAVIHHSSQEAVSQDQRAMSTSRRERAARGAAAASLAAADAIAQKEGTRRPAPATPNPLTREALAAEAAAAATLAETAAAATEEADQNEPPPGQQQRRAWLAAKAMEETPLGGGSCDPHGMATMGTELPATAVAIPETRAHALEGGDEGGFGGGEHAAFDGVQIALSPLLSKDEEDAAREFIAAGAGIAVTGRNIPFAAYVVCPSAPTPAEQRQLRAAPEADRRRHVTCHWLEMSVAAGFTIPLTGGAQTPAYRPLPCDTPMESMLGLKISTSLYDEDAKASIHILCLLLGCKYTDRLGRNKNTHLVVPVAEGKKYEAATNWGLRVVTVEWLHACVAAGRRVDEACFAPQPPRGKDEEMRQVDETSNGRHVEPMPPCRSPSPDAQAAATSAPEAATAREMGRSSRAVPTTADVSAEKEKDGAGAKRQSAGGTASRGRGTVPLLGTLGTRDLMHVLQASQPAQPPLTTAMATASVATATRSTRDAHPRRNAAAVSDGKRPRGKVSRVGSEDTTQELGRDGRDNTAEGREGRAVGAAAAVLDTVAAETITEASPARRRSSTHNTQRVQDGSQFVANLIDDVAAGMMGPGDTQMDPAAESGFDGFRVPEPVSGTSAAVDAVPPTQPIGDGEGRPGSASARKRRRGGVVDSTASGSVGGLGGGGLLLSQADVESQQVVGYADERPERLPGLRGGRGTDVGRPGGDGRLVNTLLGAAGGGSGGRGAGKRGKGASLGGGRVAGLQAEDWM